MSVLTTLLLALAIPAQENPIVATKPDPAAAISRMFARYHAATRVRAEITFTQVAGESRLEIKTQLQLDRQQRAIYVRQDRVGQSNLAWLITGDGQSFSYPLPPGQLPRKNSLGSDVLRVVEPMVAEYTQLTEKDAYAAAAGSLGDRSLPLDVLVSHRADLEFMRKQFGSIEFVREETVGDEKRNVFGGMWRDYAAVLPSGRYELTLGPEGQLRRFSREENVVAPPVNGREVPAIKIVSVWTVTEELDGKIDPRLFTVVR